MNGNLKKKKYCRLQLSKNPYEADLDIIVEQAQSTLLHPV